MGKKRAFEYESIPPVSRQEGELRPSMRQLHRVGEKLSSSTSPERSHQIVDRRTGELAELEIGETPVASPARP